MSTVKLKIDENTPWYKQWMVWMVITPPAVAVIAGVITINLAINSDDGLVVDDYYKQGLGINQTLQRDQLARDMNISGEVFIENKQLKLRLSGYEKDEEMLLHFIHPTQSQKDVKVSMMYFSENSYKAQLEKTLTGNWNLLLEPKDKTWRVMGRINFQKKSSGTLLPNLK